MSNSPPTPAASRLSRLALRWALAALAGQFVAVAAVVVLPITVMSFRAIAAIAIGWMVVLALAPWRTVAAMHTEALAIRRLTRLVRHAADAGNRAALPASVTDRHDDLGELGRAVRDVLARVHAQRRESRLLERTMDDRIQRETSRATQKLQRQATTDPLTGLGNRRSMDHVLSTFFAADRRRQRDTLVAMVIDVDLFKSVNDTLGHEVGDRCLAFLGRLLSSSLRTEDCAVRLGGDEFVILMPNQSMTEARAVATRLSALFRQMPWPHDKPPRPTLSVGIATARCDEKNGECELFRRADAALYVAKTQGRDTVSCYDPRTAA